MHDVADPTRNMDILGFIFAIAFMHARTSIEISIPGCGHLLVSSTFTLPFRRSFLPPISKPYFKAKRNRLLILFRGWYWNSYLSNSAQLATDELQSFLWECFGSIGSAHAHAMKTKKEQPQLIGVAKPSNFSRAMDAFVSTAQSPVDAIRNDNRLL